MYYALAFAAGILTCLAGCWISFVLYTKKYIDPLVATDAPLSYRPASKQTPRLAFAIVTAFIFEIIDDLQQHPMEAAKPITVMVYFVSMLYFGVPIWQSLIATTILATAMLYRFGARRIQQLAVLLLMITLMSWIGWLPTLENLSTTIKPCLGRRGS